MNLIVWFHIEELPVFYDLCCVAKVAMICNGNMRRAKRSVFGYRADTGRVRSFDTLF